MCLEKGEVIFHRYPEQTSSLWRISSWNPMVYRFADDPSAVYWYHRIQTHQVHLDRLDRRRTWRFFLNLKKSPSSVRFEHLFDSEIGVNKLHNTQVPILCAGAPWGTLPLPPAPLVWPETFTPLVRIQPHLRQADSNLRPRVRQYKLLTTSPDWHLEMRERNMK